MNASSTPWNRPSGRFPFHPLALTASSIIFALTFIGLRHSAVGASTGTYTTNSSQAWDQDSGMRTAGTAGYTISQYSFGSGTSQGQVNGGYFSTGTTIGSGTAEALQVGQTFLFRMGGEDDSGRTGFQTGGRIGF